MLQTHWSYDVREIRKFSGNYLKTDKFHGIMKIS